MQLLARDEAILTIFVVYLPYFNGDTQQIDANSETLDVLLTVIDLNKTSPMVIVGAHRLILDLKLD